MSEAPTLHLLFGMPRSGTSFLARALERAPGVAVFGESDFFGRGYRPPGSDGRYDRRALAAVAATQASKEWTTTTGELDEPLARLAPGVYAQLVERALAPLGAASPAATFQAIAAEVARHTGCATVIEKTPGHLLFVERIDAALPGVRCVASWREPAGFVRSFMRLDARDPRLAVRVLGRVSRHTALGVLMWRSYMRALERARALLGDRLLVISHADLRDDPAKTLTRVATHFGVDAPTHALDSLPRNASSGRDVGLHDLQLWLRLLADEFDHGEHEPTGALAGLGSLLRAGPAAALFLARTLPQQSGPLAYVRDYLGARRS